jgi:mono/diheme cytochrome c family protein
MRSDGMKPKYVIAAVLSLAGAGVLFTAAAFGDNDDDKGREGGTSSSWFAASSKRGVAPVTNEQYRTECAACHMAYSPGLLPARSWEKMLGGLDDHFGDNAELDPETTAILRKYLVDNAADRVDYRRSAKINRSIGKNEVPLRISETPYFTAKHDEIPARMVKDNPKVKSFANCAACHTKAEQGDFNDHDVRIPGFERSHF